MRKFLKDCWLNICDFFWEFFPLLLLFSFGIFITFSSNSRESTKEPTMVYQQQPTVYMTIDEVSLYELPVLRESKAKAYMDYRTITDKTSLQYFLINESSIVYISEEGFLKTDDGYIGVAMGSGFGDICSRFIVTLDTGIVKKLIKVENKADRDTCQSNMYDKANGIFELVVDSKTEYMQRHIGENGLVFNGDFNNCEDFKGKIIKIERVIE